MNMTLNEPASKASITAETLPDHPLFEGLSPRYRHILAECAMPANFAPGELVVESGEPANCFFLIINGRVSLEAPGANLSFRVQSIGAGDILGWSWLFPPYYWHFNAIAEVHTDAIFFYGSRLRQECDRNHDFGYELFKRMSHILIERLQSTREKWIEAAQVSACREGIVADYLII